MTEAAHVAARGAEEPRRATRAKGGFENAASNTRYRASVLAVRFGRPEGPARDGRPQLLPYN